MEPPVESALLEWSGQGAPTPCSLGEPLQQAPDTWVSSPGCPLGRGVLSPLSLLSLLSCPHCPSVLHVWGPSCCCLPLLRAPAAVELLLGDQEGTAWCHGCGAGPTSSAGLCPPATAMELPSFCSHPLWFVLALLLGMLLWATRRRAWDPRKCPTDLTGKTVIVTGANSGIGKCVAMDLARRNARTILACRSRERGQAAAEEIRAATGNPNVVLRLLDSSSLASVRAFAREVLREEKRLDVLVNNAGVTGLPFALTPEGLERTFATNYLGPFLLTNLLLDLMKASAPARIVTVSSFRHSAGTADCRFLTGRARPDSFDHIYNSTKLMNVLHTAEMAQRLQGTGVTANSLNPGVVSTGIMRNFSLVVRGLFFLISPFIKSAEQGAVSTIYCAVSEEVSGISGKYFDSDCSLTLPSAAARDAGLARKLWEESERLTGLSS
eukprot:XP_015156814.1 retinol dehydrogenase 12 isoform X1 [Gallus gallus]